MTRPMPLNHSPNVITFSSSTSQHASDAERAPCASVEAGAGAGTGQRSLASCTRCRRPAPHDGRDHEGVLTNEAERLRFGKLHDSQVWIVARLRYPCAMADSFNPYLEATAT